MTVNDELAQLRQVLGEQMKRAEVAEAEVERLTQENKRFKEIGQGFQRDYQNTFEQSCKNLQRAERAEAELQQLRQRTGEAMTDERNADATAVPIHRVTPPRLRGEPERTPTCATHGDPLVCLACEHDEEREWLRRGLTPSDRLTQQAQSISRLLQRAEDAEAERDTLKAAIKQVVSQYRCSGSLHVQHLLDELEAALAACVPPQEKP